MKKFLALAALIAVGSANAEELKFGDLNYFLKAGQFNVRADFLVNNEKARDDGTSNIEIDGYFLNTHYAYAVNDQFNVFLAVDALIDGETHLNTFGSVDAYGIQNPRIGANYRLLNQNSSSFNLDVGAEAAFKIVDREVGDQDTDGNSLDPLYSNYADPRNGVEVNARLGNKWNEANEYYILAAVNYNTKGDYENGSGDITDLDSSIDYKLGAFYQYRPVHEFMMTLGLTAMQLGEFDGEIGPAEFTVDSHIDYQFSFLAKYLINESFITKFIFTHDRRSDFEVADTEIDKRNGQQYGLGVDFLF